MEGWSCVEEESLGFAPQEENAVSEFRALDLRAWKLKAAAVHKPPNTGEKREMGLRDKAPETVAGTS